MKNSSNYPEIQKFKADLDKCTKCGFCMSACPVYREEKEESSVARGKIMLVRSLLSGGLETTKEMEKQLNRCTLCGTCAQNCPAGTHVPSIITAARADKVKKRGIPFPYSFIYRQLLPRRRLFGNVVRFASWFQGVFLPKTTGEIRHLSFFLSALGKGRHIPTIAPKFLRDSIPVVNQPPAGVPVKLTVGYFTGCMTDFVFPDLGKKIVNFLTKNGVEVVMPRGQGCCGAPVFLGAGDFAAGRKMADTNVAAFRDLDYIITDCATCASAMKDYTKFLADTDERKEAYTKYAARIKDITEFLVDVLTPPITPPRSSAVKPSPSTSPAIWGATLGSKSSRVSSSNPSRRSNMWKCRTPTAAAVWPVLSVSIFMTCPKTSPIKKPKASLPPARMSSSRIAPVVRSSSSILPPAAACPSRCAISWKSWNSP
jgi:glycolate oxidase iron-sulfur subunit